MHTCWNSLHPPHFPTYFMNSPLLWMKYILHIVNWALCFLISFLAGAFLKKTETSIGKYPVKKISQGVQLCHQEAFHLHLGYFDRLKVKNSKFSMQKRGIGAWSHRWGPVRTTQIFSAANNYRTDNTEKPERLKKILNDQERLIIGLYYRLSNL